MSDEKYRELLSPHFTLTELTKSTVADRYGIDNTCPSDEVYDSLQKLAMNILEPTRARFGQFKVMSGYRNKKVNELISGSKDSQHPFGQAADFEIGGTTNYAIAQWIAETLDFDMLSLEQYTKGKKDSGWVHCSYISKEKNRRLIVTSFSKKSGEETIKGLYEEKDED